MRLRTVASLLMFVFLMFMAFFSGQASLAAEIPDPLRNSVDTAVALVKPALVRIEVVTPSYYEGREVKYESSGSGVIVTPEGHVVTNHHVAGRATRMLCTLSTKEKIEARLVGRDPLSDIALLKLVPEAPRQFPVASWGDSTEVKVGDQVLAMGSPMALSQSVTLGIISNTEMIMPRWAGRLDEDGEDVGSFVVWLGHDAQIYGGNSGGPLVNLRGEIIGINEIRVGGLGGAIPSELARTVVSSLLEKGEVERAWLGFDIQPRFKYSPMKQGALIGNVMKATPAGDAGLKAGDYLLRLAGQEIDVAFDEQIPLFNRFVAGLPIGEPVQMAFSRDGVEQTISMTPAKRHEASPTQSELRQWGLTVQDISFLKARELRRESQDGVIITSVRPGGPAGDAKPALEEKDVITAVAGLPVKEVEELKQITADQTEGKTEPAPVLVQFERREQQLVTVVEVGIQELKDPGLEVKKAWLPIETQVITRDIARNLGDETLTGFRITRIYTGSTAQKAGLLVGDLILAVDGMELEADAPEDYEELPVLIRQYKVGTSAELSIQRNGERKTISVELVASPKLDREMKKYRDSNFEFTVRDITFFDRAREQWEENKTGVLVEEIKSGSWAALGLLGVSDLITEVSGEKVADVDWFEQKMDAVAAEKPKTVVFKVMRGIYTLFLQFEPQWEGGV
ncbi:MAG TPA: PDZ domain-containing protein [Candidatus Hydrogenedentes bacterium]|jgi:serine protease Do|nr:PDZ domain-containing protein [Candidatus Hydrogenedentota bacterium]HPK00280.1 PDZ domain-containing protein [Candidatus Hydrogenedentota bacterium]